MFCPNCGKQMNDEAAFCGNCGWSRNGKINQKRKNGFNFVRVIMIFFVLLLLALLIKFLAPRVISIFETAKIVKDESGREYYEDKDGNRLFNTWITFKGNDYYLDNLGYIIKTEWIDNYYVNDDGIKAKNDWVEWKNKWYYLKSDGEYAKNEILEIENKKYGFDMQGILYTKNFFYDPSNATKMYYADESGVIILDNFVDIDGATYYFDIDGNMAKNGWIEINGEWYYFFPNGVLAKSSWVDEKYYVDESGKMLRNAKAPNGLEFDKNGEIIPGQSLIEGTVVMLTGGRSALRIIDGALVEFYDTKNQNERVGSTLTDSQGKYQYYLRKGNYKVVVNADGYESMDSIETINENENKYMELVSLFPSGQSGNGSAAGQLTNALDGQPISLATLKVRNNWNNFDGDLATDQVYQTDANGYFVINNLPVGYYTIEASKNNFITGYNNIALLSDNPVIDYYFSVNPEMPNDGNIRVVLNWGLEPSDLDSHLIGRKPNGNYFDVYFGDKNYTYNGTAMANLDVDDTSSYGPETETITSDLNGTYVYGVHDYSNGGSLNSNKLSYSNCKVTVYMGSQIVAVYNVPTGKIGTFWEVFRINEDRTIVPINQIYNYNPTSKDYNNFNLQVRTNPKYSSTEYTTNQGTSNGLSSSSGSSSSNNSNSSSSFTMDYGQAINEKYDFDEENEVTIKIRRPRINGGDAIILNEINGSIGNAMDEIITWCEEYIDNASECPRTININRSDLTTANSSTIKIKITGVITFKGSNNTENVSFLFTHDIGTGEYSLVKQ